MPPPIHFCTFGNTPKYSATLARIKREAETSGYFASITVYTQENTPGLEQHAAFIASHPRGYGYWIWKPLVLLDRMRTVPEGDIVIYMDAGCSIQPPPATRSMFDAYIDAVSTHPSHRIGFLQGHIESTWCKEDLFERLNVDKSSPIRSTGQYLGGVQIMVNTPANRKLLEKWYTLMEESNYRYVDDSPSKEPNAPTFREHRHDQAIISILFKQNGCATVRMPPFIRAPPQTDPFPFLTLRIRTG